MGGLFLGKDNERNGGETNGVRACIIWMWALLLCYCLTLVFFKCSVLWKLIKYSSLFFYVYTVVIVWPVRVSFVRLPPQTENCFTFCKCWTFLANLIVQFAEVSYSEVTNLGILEEVSRQLKMLLSAKHWVCVNSHCWF